jgi:hypothetical protein
MVIFLTVSYTTHVNVLKQLAAPIKCQPNYEQTRLPIWEQRFILESLLGLTS